MAEGQQRVLGGRYLLKDKVGTGGMAVVYRAQDQRLDRTVAVKLMLPQYAGDATFAARFKQEAQAAAGLSSPYIVGVYDWGKDGDTYYIVMEYLRGTDLKSGIRSHGALDPRKVAQIGSQICSALSVAHRHEIIHRDIKPQNIMVLPDGNIKVMDFGIARAKNSHLTQDNNVLGTAHYVSPEQTRGQELGPTSDIYSLGVVMYECATGRVPFDGDDAISVALKQVNELPVPPSQVNPNVDGDLERIILKCMEKDPANRFQTADELRGVLNSYLAGRTVDVAEPTRVISGAMPMGGADATETRVMSDATQAMVRPVGGATASRPNPSVAPGYEAPEPQPEGMGKGKIAVIVVGIIAAIAVAVFAASILFSGGGEKMATVPNILNYEQEQAVQTLKDAGFEPKIGTSDFSDTVPEGQVMDQTPDGNKQAPEGSEVTLIISKGQKPVEQVQVPNITGKTEDEALQLLQTAGLTGKKAGEEANDAEAGTVFWQGSNTGAMLDKGSEVEYKVSSGPDEINVPGVLKKSYDDAYNELSALGLTVKRADGDYNDDYAEGTVMAQDISGKAEDGATVTLTVSPGPDPNVTVPNVAGKSESAATSELKNAGLSVNVQTQTSSTVPEGNVISQSVTGTAKKGSAVTIVVSGGPGASAGNNTSGNASSGNSPSSNTSSGNASGNTNTQDPNNTAGNNVMNRSSDE